MQWKSTRNSILQDKKCLVEKGKSVARLEPDGGSASESQGSGTGSCCVSRLPHAPVGAVDPAERTRLRRGRCDWSEPAGGGNDNDMVERALVHGCPGGDIQLTSFVFVELPEDERKCPEVNIVCHSILGGLNL